MWTTSFPLPIASRNSLKADSFASVVNIGDNIWTITETHYTGKANYVMDIWMFNITTSQYTQIEFETPEKFGDIILAIKSFEDQIYIWRACDDENMLFKFDTKTCTLSYLLSIRVETHDIRKCEIIGNLMVALEYEERETENELYMHTINLDTNKVQSKEFLKHCVPTICTQLCVNNGELYLYECVSNMDRTMYKINNGKLDIVSKDQLNNGKEGLFQRSDLTDHGVFYTDRDEMDPMVYCDTFDYKARKWTRSVSTSPYTFPHLSIMKGDVHIDNKIYALIDRSYTEEIRYDIRVFEKVPRLESSCLMKVVNDYMENCDDQMVIRVMQLLPMTMRMQLDDMIRWRVEDRMAESIEQWRQEMIQKCVEEYQMMEEDETYLQL